MSKRMLLLVALLVLLLLSSAAQAQSQVGDPSQTMTLTGGAYQLVMTVQQVGGETGSIRYQLAPSSPALDGSGCCCKGYLPCVNK